MLGWLSLPASDASLRKSFSKRFASSSPISESDLASFTATLRSLNGSSARYTSADAPCPSSERMVYLPILWGRSDTRDIGRKALFFGKFTRLPPWQGLSVAGPLQRSRERQESGAADVAHRERRGGLRVAVVAEQRAAIGRIVVALEQVA